MRGEATTYDQIAATIFSMLPVCWAQVLTPLPISDVGAAMHIPSADEEERTEEHRHFCKMLKPTLLALDLLQHQGPLWTLNSMNTNIFLLSPEILYPYDLMMLLHLFMQNYLIEHLVCIWQGGRRRPWRGEGRAQKWVLPKT